MHATVCGALYTSRAPSWTRRATKSSSRPRPWPRRESRCLSCRTAAAAASQVVTLLLARAGRNRGHERIGVELPVRVVKGHPDLDTTVLERKHVLDLVLCAELDVTVRPDVDEQFEVRQRQPTQRR